MIDGDLTLRHHAVQRDDAPGPDHNQIAGLHLPNGDQYLVVPVFQPHPVYVKGQTLRQVGHRLLPCPVFQQLPDLQQEHDGAGGAKVPAAGRNPDGQGIQQLHLDLTPSQTAKALAQERRHVPNHPGNPQRRRQEQGGRRLYCHLTHQFLLELPVHSPGAVIGEGDRRFCPGPGERAECGENRFPLPCKGHDETACALMDSGFPDPGLALQPGLQQVGLTQGQVFLPEAQT